MNNMKGIYTSIKYCPFLQFLLFHLGIETFMCSLMRKIHLYVIHNGVEDLLDRITFLYKKSELQLKKCLLSFLLSVFFFE